MDLTISRSGHLKLKKKIFLGFIFYFLLHTCRVTGDYWRRSYLFKKNVTVCFKNVLKKDLNELKY